MGLRLIRGLGEGLADQANPLREWVAILAVGWFVAQSILALAFIVFAVYVGLDAQAERSAIRADLRRENDNLDRRIRSMHAEFTTWRSRTDYDVVRLFRYIESAGVKLPPGDVPIGVTSPKIGDQGGDEE